MTLMAGRIFIIFEMLYYTYQMDFSDRYLEKFGFLYYIGITLVLSISLFLIFKGRDFIFLTGTDYTGHGVELFCSCTFLAVIVAILLTWAIGKASEQPLWLPLLAGIVIAGLCAFGVNGGQAVEDAFQRMFGISLKKANALNMSDLEVKKR